ncbi:Uncharacterised protein [Serratia fonticola]|uniref:Uncharacterized protein n=1 Tax=Serratia fonticola TaxID=47917 RepID=A0A4U9VLB7_SERFO|nr:Uncharacterised protein [Serratia fonticola]
MMPELGSFLLCLALAISLLLSIYPQWGSGAPGYAHDGGSPPVNLMACLSPSPWHLPAWCMRLLPMTLPSPM